MFCGTLLKQLLQNQKVACLTLTFHQGDCVLSLSLSLNCSLYCCFLSGENIKLMEDLLIPYLDMTTFRVIFWFSMPLIISICCWKVNLFFPAAAAFFDSKKETVEVFRLYLSLQRISMCKLREASHISAALMELAVAQNTFKHIAYPFWKGMRGTMSKPLQHLVCYSIVRLRE